MPVSVQELNKAQSTPMAEFYDAEGVTPQKLAKTGKELLEAVSVKHIKLKGWFDKTIPLSEGYRIIKGTLDECLIEQLLVDNGTRFRAWVEISKQMGLYPSEKISVKHGFDSLVGEVVQGILKASNGVPPLPSMEQNK